ncbi:hypothetical protein [Thermosphaera sp.]
MRFKTVLALTIAILITGFILHMPVEVQEYVFHSVFNPNPIYNDLYNSNYKGILANPCGNPTQWFNQAKRSVLCSGESVFPTAYLDYKLPEPPLAGLAFTVLTALAFLFSSNVFSTAYATALYIVQSIISIMSVFLALILFNRKLSNRFNEHWLPLGFASLLVYGIYSLNSLILPLYVLFLTSLLEREHHKALLYAGLLTAWNPFFTILFGLSLAYMLESSHPLKHYAGLLPPLIAFSALYVVNPSSLEYLVSNYLTPVFNSSVYWLFTGSVNTQALYAVSWGVLSTVILILYGLKPLGGHIALHATILVLASWVLNPVAVPQTILFAIPLLYLCSSDPRLRASALISEVLNALIILLWFQDRYLREVLNKTLGLGLPVENNPASTSSPVFWIIQVRNILLLALTVRMFSDYWELVISAEKH